MKKLLEKIRQERGFDFTQYRLCHLERRIGARLKANSLQTYEAYSCFLDEHPDEFAKLFNTLLIHVTEFFRNPKAWEVIKKEVLPEIIQSKEARGLKTIRLWSAGCSTGEETYTAAICLQKVLGERLYDFKIKIYGTDLDKKGLAQAMEGRYEKQSLVVEDRLRLCTQFRVHDMVTQEPLKNIDLLICRNVVIYFTKELQEKICRNFFRALNPGGFLMLGISESLPATMRDHFRSIDSRERIFQKR